MSSHHVVRDEQEPAVVIASPPGTAFSRLADMFEWSPVVVVLAEALSDFLQRDTKLDIVAGDAKTLEAFEQQLAFQEPYQKVISQKAVLEAALQYLIDKNHRTVHIFMYQPEPNLVYAKFGDKLELVFFDKEMKIVQSKAKLYSKWVAKGTKFKEVAGKINATENLKQTGNYFEAIENGFVNFYGESEFWMGEILVD
jgi:thiamine pyrophosphokinase